jgi:hypothetical protein
VKRSISVVLICAALCLPMQAKDSYPQLGWTPDGRFHVLTHKNFVHPMRAVRYYLAYHHRSQVVNHLCFVGYSQKSSPHSPEGTAIAYVYWKEGNRLIFWPGTMEETPDFSLTIPAHDLGWEKDTVEREDQVYGDHLVTRAFWKSVVADCYAHGETLTVAPAKTPAPK